MGNSSKVYSFFYFLFIVHMPLLYKNKLKVCRKSTNFYRIKKKVIYPTKRCVNFQNIITDKKNKN